jgi:ABC-2 type transport system ATP-binding protein
MTAAVTAAPVAEAHTGDEAAAAPAVSLRGVSVAYGRRVVISGLDLAVPHGEVYALLGRNGSGKSSLVRVLLGLQRPMAGEVRMRGVDPWVRRWELMRAVGYLPEQSTAPPEMTARALLAFCARVRGGADEDGARERLRRFGVPLELPFRRLSKGQRRQVELALALAHRPPLLVLDDPSLGLDPLARRAFFGELLVELADRQATVLVTTHDLEAVEGVATRVGVLSAGRLLVDEPLETLKGRFRRLRIAASREEELQGLRPLRRRAGPWGSEVVVEGWREPAPAGVEARAMALEEIFAALHDEEPAGEEVAS